MSDTRPDVVVIGGGIVGASASAFLAEAGASVVLVEQEAIGAAASGRNSGVVQHPFDPVLTALYLDSVELYRRLADESADFELPSKPAGLLLVSADVDGVRRLTADLTATVPHVQPSFVDGPALRALEPALAPDVAACRLAIGYPVAPGAAVRAYADLAAGRGARLALGDPAELLIDGDRVRGVRVGADIIEAGTLVVTGGPWTPSVLDPGGRWQPIVRSWGVIAELALPAAPHHVLEEAEIDAAIEPPAQGGEVDLSGVAFSLVTAADRSALGSTFLAERPDPEGMVPALIERGSRFVPGLASVPIVASRVCARPVSRDGRPLVGHVPWLRDAFVAAGHGPWGISTGPATGRLVADVVLGRQRAIPAALDPGRFMAP